ncbi:Molybdopterin molybdenumtransferase [uncultured Gammaproteobacteria bacterium]
MTGCCSACDQTSAPAPAPAAAGKRLLPWAEVLARLPELVQPVAATELVPLAAARGRILAEDVIAGRAVPPAAVSAVDGYACFAADLSALRPTALPVVGRIAAGHPFHRPLARGEAVRIFTGAPLPAGVGVGNGGPEVVAMQEDCRLDGDTVLMPAGLGAGANRREAGEDVRAGQVLLKRGQRLRAPDLGVAAGQGRAQLPVFRRLKVAIFSTGDELSEPGTVVPECGIYDSNRFTLAGLLAGLAMVEVTDLGILPDRPAEMRESLARLIAAGDHDAVLTTGGVSVGDEDHVKAVVAELGRLDLWRLAIKPGKPVAVGRLGPMPFVGLPGNPVAVVVGFMVMARPLLLRLAGAERLEPLRLPVPAGFSFKKTGGRREFVPARLERDEAGMLAAQRIVGNSATLSVLTGADGWVELPEADCLISPGMIMDFIPLSEIL